jgi:hypothetical protein
MAADSRLVIVTGKGLPPDNYTTAHESTAGSPVIITAPAGEGCSVQFACPVLSTVPNVPQQNGIYWLTPGLLVNFFLDVTPAKGGHTDVQFYVGPYGATGESDSDVVPTSELSPAAHTVRVGSGGGTGSGSGG